MNAPLERNSKGMRLQYGKVGLNLADGVFMGFSAVAASFNNAGQHGLAFRGGS